MACRNLSQRGIGLLHRSYVHLGTTCSVLLPHPRKGEQEYRGTVVRCLHLSGMVHEIGIRFNGKERLDVEEYCISEGWIKVPAGKTVDRKGHPLLLKLKGTVEVYYR